MNPHSPKNPVVLLFLAGFMASGKSSLGRKAARKAGFSFLDLDEVLEKREGKSVAEIFATDGEGYFRKRESESLKSLKELPGGKYLVALGGGTPCFRENTSWMKSNGTMIYLRHRPGILVHRLTQKEEDRPLIGEMSPEIRGESIRKLLYQRESWYLQADYILQENMISAKGLSEFLALF